MSAASCMLAGTFIFGLGFTVGSLSFAANEIGWKRTWRALCDGFAEGIGLRRDRREDDR